MERPLVKSTGSEQLDNVKRQVPLDLQKCINHRTAAVLGESSEMLERKPECRINRSLRVGFSKRVSIMPNTLWRDGKFKCKQTSLFYCDP